MASDTILDPAEYSAVRLTLRPSAAGSEVAVCWFYPSLDAALAQEDASAIPCTYPQAMEGGTWQTIVVRLSDAVHYDPTQGAVSVMLLVGADGDAPPWERGVGVLDIDRIELVRVKDEVVTPSIAAIEPPQGRRYATVAIEGSGFAQPAKRNRAFFGDTEVEIVSGDSRTVAPRRRRDRVAEDHRQLLDPTVVHQRNRVLWHDDPVQHGSSDGPAPALGVLDLDTRDCRNQNSE